MQTFAQWRTQVKAAFGGEATASALLMAAKDYARSVLVRDSESDLALSKSYENRFKEQLVELCGARFTDVVATVITNVRNLMPDDDDTPAYSDVLDNAITAAFNRINAAADEWDSLLLEAAVDLQRHVPFYQVRQEATYLEDSAGVTTSGFVSTVALPDGARVEQLWFGHYYPQLEPDVEYEAEDIVMSNGRAYEVVAGGTLTIYDMGDGLTSTDGTEETLGTLTFKYSRGERVWPVRKVEWSRRNFMQAGDGAHGPVYTMDPQSETLWLYPAVDAEHRFILDYIAVAEAFEDTDDVKFDLTAAEAAAHYIHSKLLVRLGERTRASDDFALFQRAVRKAVLDNEARDVGMGAMVAPYDWRRRSLPYGSAIFAAENYNPGAGGMNINDYVSKTNASGTTSIAIVARNQKVGLTITGAASTRTVVFSRNNAQRGDHLTVKLALPATADIVIDFRSGTASGPQILLTQNFEDNVYTTDGLVTGATFEFTYSGANWEYDSSSIPS